jgi:hypothetical protein
MSESTPIPADVLACPDESFAVRAWASLVLSHFASYIAARYNGPVYLVGSALRLATPRDVDVRVVVADKEFCGRYGYKEYNDWAMLGPNQAWIDDMAKRNGELAAMHRINADFQVYCASGCIQYRGQPRVLLASPSNLDHIAASTAWFDGPDSETPASGSSVVDPTETRDAE